MKLITRIVFFSFIFFTKAALAQKVIFVEPKATLLQPNNQNPSFRTIERAVEEANNYWKNSAEDVIIFVQAGKYYLDRPIVISNSTLSNKREGSSLTIMGNGSTFPIISGGAEIKNWVMEETGVYSAPASQKPFRQLYIKGEKAVRAREPNICDYYRLNWNVDNKTIFVPSALQNYNLADRKTEIFIQKIWSCQIFRINEKRDFSGYTELSFLPEEEQVFTTRTWQIKDNQSFHLENNIEFLDANNEWYLDNDRNVIYLYKSDINSVNELEVEVPQLENLLIVHGDEDKKLSNINIHNLVFENTNWTFPDTSGLYAGQVTYIYNLIEKQPKNGAILIENASNIDISKNVIRNIGGNAIMLYHNVSNSKVNGNIIKDISANGIVVDWYLNKNLKNNTFSNAIEINSNLITRIGQDYFGSVGIASGYSYDLNIESNFLYDFPYSGISLGWGHTYDSTSIRNNIVRYNYIGNVMNKMSDGAAIYTLSNQPGTLIESNFIENIIQSKWSFGRDHVYGIYLDEGSSNITVKNNKTYKIVKNFTINTKSINTIDFNGEVSLLEFKQKNKLYENYDSLKSDYVGSMRCIDNITENSIHVVPNPIRSDFYFVLSSNFADEDINSQRSKNIKFEVYSIEGRKIYNGKASHLRDNIYFSSLSHKIKNGVYIFQILFSDKYYTAKVIVDN